MHMLQCSLLHDGLDWESIMAKQLQHEIDIQITRILMKMSGDGSFDEESVRSLYTHVRQHAAKNGYTRDIADFFAHTERDRGKIHDQLRPKVKAFREWERLQFRPDKQPKANTIPHTVIMNDLNSELKSLGLEPLAGRPCDAVALVLMSALQGSSIEFDNGETVKLHLFSLADQGVNLYGSMLFSAPAPTGEPGVAFPIIAMPNMFGIPPFKMQPHDPGRSVLRVSFEGGQVRPVQELVTIRGEFVPGGVIDGGRRTVALGIPMVQPLAIRPPEKPGS